MDYLKWFVVVVTVAILVVYQGPRDASFPATAASIVALAVIISALFDVRWRSLLGLAAVGTAIVGAVVLLVTPVNVLVTVVVALVAGAATWWFASQNRKLARA